MKKHQTIENLYKLGNLKIHSNLQKNQNEKMKNVQILTLTKKRKEMGEIGNFIKN